MRACTPLWAWCLLGWLAFDAGRGLADGPPPAVIERFATLRARHQFELDPTRMSLRELRILPGIGAKRALAIHAGRDRHRMDADRMNAEPFAWTDVHGIGERTAARVAEWLATRRTTEAGEPVL